MLYEYIYKSQIGNIFIAADSDSIMRISFNCVDNLKIIKKNNVIREAIKQLDEYFSGKRKNFDMPLNIQGTEFQKRVWNELIKIPYGQTKTYKEIASAIGNKNASRAVGNANNKNPISIVIPCHRVIGTNSKLIGYAGGLYKKQKLLELEHVFIR